jgi:hypothetical protein
MKGHDTKNSCLLHNSSENAEKSKIQACCTKICLAQFIGTAYRANCVCAASGLK